MRSQSLHVTALPIHLTIYNFHITLFIYIAHNVQNLPLQLHLVSSCDILDELSGIAGCGPSLLICKNKSELCTLKLI